MAVMSWSSIRKRMCSSGRDLQPVARRQFRQFATKIDNLSPALRASLQISVPADYRLMQLELDLLFQNHFAAVQDLLDVRTQLARLRINNLEFLFDAESKRDP
jgi:hypothetical protein